MRMRFSPLKIPLTLSRPLGGGDRGEGEALDALISQRGIALLMVLWVLAILMVIVLSFSYMTRTETQATLSFKHGLEKKFLAEAGIERGIMEIFYRNANKTAAVTLEGREAWKVDGRYYRVETDNGYFMVSITDDSGKVDINTTPDVILRNLFGNLGLKLEDVDTIVDSIMDWKDADDLHRLHGAESDYYMSLQNPYKPKNADLETLEELLLVRGMTPEILYGDEGTTGIIDFLTVNSKAGKINLNAAPKEVLLAIPGMSPEIADAIITGREVKEIQDSQGILGQNYSVMAPFIDLTGANTFTINAAGYKGSEKAGYAVRATVNIEGNNKYKYIFYKSPADKNI